MSIDAQPDGHTGLTLGESGVITPRFAQRPATPPHLREAATLALFVMAVIVTVATAVAFVESFNGLLVWARGHGLTGWRATIWPLQADAFIAIGELTLFAAIVRHWPTRAAALGWTVTAIGLAASVTGNIGHVSGHNLAWQATAALPPLAASAGLMIGMQVLKWVVTIPHPTAATHPLQAPAHPPVSEPSIPSETSTPPTIQPAVEPAPATIAAMPTSGIDDADLSAARQVFTADLAAGRRPTIRAIKDCLNVGQTKAQQLQALLSPKDPP